MLWQLPLGARITCLLGAVIFAVLVILWKTLPDVTKAELLSPVIHKAPSQQTDAAPLHGRNDVVTRAASDTGLPHIVTPRVVLHVKYGQSPALATRVKATLVTNGYNVPDIRIVDHGRGPAYTQVRYFRQADKPAAQILVNLLRDAGASDAKKDLIAADRELPPNVFEIWFDQQ